jgi:hypothetical protein
VWKMKTRLLICSGSANSAPPQKRMDPTVQIALPPLPADHRLGLPAAPQQSQHLPTKQARPSALTEKRCPPPNSPYNSETAPARRVPHCTTETDRQHTHQHRPGGHPAPYEPATHLRQEGQHLPPHPLSLCQEIEAFIVAARKFESIPAIGPVQECAGRTHCLFTLAIPRVHTQPPQLGRLSLVQRSPSTVVSCTARAAVSSSPLPGCCKQPGGGCAALQSGLACNTS